MESNIIVFIFTFFVIVVLTVLGILWNILLNKNGDIKIHPKNIRPGYYGYHGGFWKVNKCYECGLTGMYEDLHAVSCCPDCGGNVTEYTAAKWEKDGDTYRWVTKKEKENGANRK